MRIHTILSRKQVHTRLVLLCFHLSRWKYRRFCPRWLGPRRSSGQCSICSFRGGVGGAWGRWKRSHKEARLHRWVQCGSKVDGLRLLLKISKKMIYDLFYLYESWRERAECQAKPTEYKKEQKKAFEKHSGGSQSSSWSPGSSDEPDEPTSRSLSRGGTDAPSSSCDRWGKMLAPRQNLSPRGGLTPLIIDRSKVDSCTGSCCKRRCRKEESGILRWKNPRFSPSSSLQESPEHLLVEIAL